MFRLQQIAEKENIDLTQALCGHGGILGGTPLSATGLFAYGNEYLRRRFIAEVEAVQDFFFEQKELRKLLGWTVHDRTKLRTIVMPMGAVTVRNDQYRDKDGHQFSVLNEMLGYTKYQRVDETVRNAVREYAAAHSYRETAETIAAGDFGKTSAFNFIRNWEAPVIAPCTEKRVVKYLIINIDEDHIALQTKHKGEKREKECMFLSIGVIVEGREKVGKDRYRNIHPICFVDKDTDALQLQLAAYIHENYDIDALERIYVVGDGALWIQKTNLLDEWFPGLVEHVFDKFHLVRDLQRLNKQFKGCKASQRIRKAMEEKDKAKLDQILDDLAQKASTQTQKTRLARSRAYYEACFDSMCACLQEGAPTSSTEAYVSHISAARMSTPGGAWSVENAIAVGRMRALQFNGGSLTDPGTFRDYEWYKPYLDDLEDVSGVKDFSLFDLVHDSLCGPGGTTHQLSLIGHGGQLFGARGESSMA